MSDDHLWTAYAQTVLRFGGAHPFKVDLRRPISEEQRRLLTELGPARTFAIVTPFDPRGLRAPAWQNWWRHRRLRALLDARGLRHIPADGLSLDALHRERGFAIAIGRGEAAALARGLEQLAIYWFDGEDFWIDGALAPRTPRRLP